MVVVRPGSDFRDMDKALVSVIPLGVLGESACNVRFVHGFSTRCA